MKGINLTMLMIFIGMMYLILPALGIWAKPADMNTNQINNLVPTIILYAGLSVIGGFVAGSILNRFLGANPAMLPYYSFFMGIWGVGTGMIANMLSSSGIGNIASLFWISIFLTILGLILGAIGAIQVGVGGFGNME